MTALARGLVLASGLLLAPLAQAQFLFGRLLPPAPATEANGPSAAPTVSANGKVFAFESSATNWVPGSLTGAKIISIDLVAGNTLNLSTTSGGNAFNGNSFAPSTSRNGRYTAFETQANNLDLGVGTNGFQIVRKDRQTGALVLASASAAGAPASGSAAGQGRNASISGDGRYVVFRSDAANLVGGDVLGEEDAFVKDLQTGAIEVASLNANGQFTSPGITALSGQSISDDGRYVVFSSAAGNIVAGVGSGTIQVYVRDLVTDTSTLASRSAAGAAANSQSDLGAISPNGRFVSFRSFATNLAGGPFASRVYVHDRTTLAISSVPLPVLNAVTATGCRENDVADNGVVVLTCFFGSGLFDQVFLHIPGAVGTPFLISSDINDVAGNQASGTRVAINASGLSMVFDSRASNLVGNDFNGVSDNFILIDESILDGIFADGFE
jgi:Tol biopolymer transport system component